MQPSAHGSEAPPEAAFLNLFRFQNLSRAPGVVHGISTRTGGVSEGRCATLNTSYTVEDEPARVDENLRRIAQALGTERERFFWPYQVHGNAVVAVTSTTPPRPRCDVLITRDADVKLLLRYADCTPILLADPVNRAVAGVHAGWRGTAVNAAGAAVAALHDRFGSNPRDLLAGIGPAIGPCCYSVGDDVVEAFADRPWAIARPAGEQPRLDLWEANRRALIGAGVPQDQVELAAICTRCHADRFFSHRANGGLPAGRFAAMIGCG